MISDVLAEATQRIDGYLHEPALEATYPAGDLLERIVAVRDEMEAIRIALDTPPRRAAA